MDVARMLKNMCHEVLSEVDVKAIAKSRGFSAKETASRALFENFFLSDRGVTAALGSLTREEVALLHLLKFTGETVDVTFFERLYGEKGERTWYYGSFTRRYQEVFKKVQSNFVRKGVLLIAESDAGEIGLAKMERWRFRFPREFERYLPPLFSATKTMETAGDIRFSATKTMETAGDIRKDVLRRKLKEIIKGKSLAFPEQSKKYDLALSAGDLLMGDGEFHARRLLDWQQACWAAAAGLRKKDKEEQASPIELVVYAVAQLKPNEWILPEELATPLKIFYNRAKHPSGQEICVAGWEWGGLAKHEADGATYYRLPENPLQDAVDAQPESYLHIGHGPALIVDLDTIPYEWLEALARMSSMKVVDARLTAMPNLIKIGKTPEALRAHPLTAWLREKAASYRQALETVEERWGKQIIHENLFVARVKDLSLQVAIKKSFPDPQKIALLPNGFIAFPQGSFEDIEKLVRKSGHVIKLVKAK